MVLIAKKEIDHVQENYCRASYCDGVCGIDCDDSHRPRRWFK